ncbi:MAG: Rieske 2Fe-2S domain-containing protein [Rhodospirillaceae bacterium]|jgi:phenylpropionate dioxygenase-like ring-hydroxylating dioxygenase large terminal subunit|nr:Rieske 2Fe-2S domain-containing protein [Rhodospirillaceae bacterium]MBT5240939.1 Rieske 2Fe-2S domain-containing protein [Rhodospirillaceae bacterium]MBT5564555.1 Rieske 2Fe-2S domain-containing protein [Rhodospirillaceae bacterium]MBT6090890.1 Rieske 2Fe-2S domain-containing protein [Rhodospirillaceae bacterium]MBT7450894.1 Rieske 2Fe-2S domain-containing protein [Rhodospirillaceae bacterium]
MFMNFWYAAEESENITNEPAKVHMLGQDFVLFRDTGGKVHCLSNLCVHRGASLAHGKVKGDNIECPYHGWQFKGKDGVCTKIPSLGPDAKIPSRAKVDSYPTEERYGLVFAFLGDLPESERPPIIDIPEWDQDGWRFTLMRYTWEANYQRALENSLDPAHTEFVHPAMGYQGDRDDYKVPDLEVTASEWGVGTMTIFQSPDLPHEKMKGIKGEGQMEAGTTMCGISQAVTKLHFSPVAWAHQYTFTTPVDEHHTARFFLQGRNFRTDPEMDAPVNERNLIVADQDKVVIERLEPFHTPESSTEEVLVKSDLVITRFRELLADWEARGWKIDSDSVDQFREHKAHSVPSPARRTVKSWAINAVPTCVPKQTTRVAAE